MRRLAALLSALTLLAVACGNDSASTTHASVTTGAAATTQTVTTQAGTTTTPATTETTTTSPPTVTETSPPEVFDGRIGVSVVEVTTGRVALPEYDLPAAEDGHAYLSVHVTVTRVESVLLVGFWAHENENSLIPDTAGQTYEPVFATVGVRFTDPQDIRSPFEVVEGSEGVAVFEVPEGSRITDLTLIYSHRESWDEALPQERGEIVLALDSTA